MKNITDKIKVGQIVMFSKSIREFCDDFDVSLEESDEIMSYTFLVLSVCKESLEAEVLTHQGNVLRLGFHDLVSVSKNGN